MLKDQVVKAVDNPGNLYFVEVSAPIFVPPP
jgi:hypothetical protein